VVGWKSAIGHIIEVRLGGIRESTVDQLKVRKVSEKSPETRENELLVHCNFIDHRWNFIKLALGVNYQVHAFTHYDFDVLQSLLHRCWDSYFSSSIEVFDLRAEHMARAKYHDFIICA
jgi:hypothetical protein